MSDRARLRERIRTLLESGPKSTLELKVAIDDYAVYGECRDMADEGILRTWQEPGGPERFGFPRRFYALYYQVSRPAEKS